MTSTPQKKSVCEQAAEAWGIDLSLIEANLERTPTERFEIHQQMLETAIQLQEAMKRARIKKVTRTSA